MIWRVEHLVTVDSTNTWLAQRALTGAPEGSVVLTDFQSAGRGRLGRQWVAPPGSALLCSILLRPELGADQLQLAVAAVALAARAALVRLSGCRAQLKWPNDLVVDGAKLAGLLAEVVTTPEGLAMVIGIGVNLNESPEGVDATSIRACTGVRIVPRGLLDILLEELEGRRAQLDSDEGRADLHQEYEAALATLGQDVRIIRADDEIQGVARGVDASGRLLVDVDGTVLTFATGDVVHVRRVERGQS